MTRELASTLPCVVPPESRPTGGVLYKAVCALHELEGALGEAINSSSEPADHADPLGSLIRDIAYLQRFYEETPK